MRILILNPPFDRRISRASRGPAVGRGGTLYYPFWLAYATGGLEDAGFDVRLVDAIARRLSRAEVVELARQYEPSLTILDIAAPSLQQDFRTATDIKAAVGGIMVAVGPHASAQAREVLTASSAFDAVARGEYDETVRELAERIRDGRRVDDVAGLVLRASDHTIENPPRPLIEDLDQLPFVSRVYKRHLRIEDYFYSANLHPEVAILSGRGCPYRCYWCLYPQTMTGHRFRARSPENFIAELEYIHTELPQVREIFIEDDTFTADCARAEEICRLIRARRLKVRWACNVRPDLKRETLRTMKAAGCRMILVGFESGNQAVLDGMCKGLKVTRAHEFVRDARGVGLVVHGCFTAGGQNETPATLRDTLQMALSLNLSTAQFCPIMVYPGTRAYGWARDHGYLASTDFATWITPEGTHNCQVSTPALSATQITEFCDYARRQFYLRPRYLLRTALWASTRPREWPRMARGVRNLARFLSRFGGRTQVRKLQDANG